MRPKVFIAIPLFLLIATSVMALDQINISFTQPRNMPYYVGAPELNIDAEEFTTIVLRMKSNKSGTARLFWATSFDPKMNEPKSVWFFIDKSNDFKVYTFNLRQQNPYWVGFVGQLLILPENGPEGIEIESAKAVPGSFFGNISAGWREFWGPRGRFVVGSTINTIQPSTLFGRPIYVYIYWLLGLIAAGYFSYKTYQWYGLKKKPSLETVWLDTGKRVFMAVIVFWGLLEGNSLFNNWLAFKDDLKYFGKSYRDKLVLANTGDFYPFIEFCQANLPADAEFDFRIQPIYGDIKTKYYLYPRKFRKEAEYLIVYDADSAGGYAPWKTFRDKAYILRKK